MHANAWRILAPVLGFLFNTGLTVSGWANTTVAFICWGLMIPVIMVALFWPRIQARIEGWGISTPLDTNRPAPSSEAVAQERWRGRIEEWRRVVLNFDFENERFASTDTYSQMKPHLQPEVVKMFEKPRTVHIGNPARGDTTYRYTLLDEIARIEKEWGLV